MPRNVGDSSNQNDFLLYFWNYATKPQEGPADHKTLDSALRCLAGLVAFTLWLPFTALGGLRHAFKRCLASDVEKIKGQEKTTTIGTRTLYQTPVQPQNEPIKKLPSILTPPSISSDETPKQQANSPLETRTLYRSSVPPQNEPIKQPPISSPPPSISSNKKPKQQFNSPLFRFDITSREEANRLLSGKPVGSFILRSANPNSQDPRMNENCLALSIMKDDKIEHQLLVPTENKDIYEYQGKYGYSKTGTLEEIANYFKEMQGTQTIDTQRPLQSVHAEGEVKVRAEAAPISEYAQKIVKLQKYVAVAEEDHSDTAIAQARYQISSLIADESFKDFQEDLIRLREKMSNLKPKENQPKHVKVSEYEWGSVGLLGLEMKLDRLVEGQEGVTANKNLAKQQVENLKKTIGQCTSETDANQVMEDIDALLQNSLFFNKKEAINLKVMLLQQLVKIDNLDAAERIANKLPLNNQQVIYGLRNIVKELVIRHQADQAIPFLKLQTDEWDLFRCLDEIVKACPLGPPNDFTQKLILMMKAPEKLWEINQMGRSDDVARDKVAWVLAFNGIKPPSGTKAENKYIEMSIKVNELKAFAEKVILREILATQKDLERTYMQEAGSSSISTAATGEMLSPIPIALFKAEIMPLIDIKDPAIQQAIHKKCFELKLEADRSLTMFGEPYHFSLRTVPAARFLMGQSKPEAGSYLIGDAQEPPGAYIISILTSEGTVKRYQLEEDLTKKGQFLLKIGKNKYPGSLDDHLKQIGCKNPLSFIGGKDSKHRILATDLKELIRLSKVDDVPLFKTMAWRYEQMKGNYYHSNLKSNETFGREEAEKYLKDMPDGSYILRDSHELPAFTLSKMDNGQILHIPIIPTERNKFLIQSGTYDGKAIFEYATLDEALEYCGCNLSEMRGKPYYSDQNREEAHRRLIYQLTGTYLMRNSSKGGYAIDVKREKDVLHLLLEPTGEIDPMTKKRYFKDPLGKDSDPSNVPLTLDQIFEKHKTTFKEPFVY